MNFEDAIKLVKEGRQVRSSSFEPGEYIFIKQDNTSTTTTGYLGQSCGCHPKADDMLSTEYSGSDWFIYKKDNKRGVVPYYPDQFDMVKAEWTI